MPPPRRNVEVKARDDDPAATLARATALGARDEGVLRQRDTYFATARGRLKLREQEGAPAQLIAYERPDEESARTSEYRLVEISDPEALRATLDPVVVVDKRRHLLLHENVRIHLDEVEGLGSFVELEAVAPPESDLSAERALVARLTDELALGERVAVSYSDLLLGSRDALLAAADRAMRNAYARYSDFKVGAALRTRSGAIVVAAGEREIAAVAVVAEKLDVCPPCGGCRQRLSEFARADTPVYLGRPGGPVHETTIGELLPLAFEQEALS